VKTEKYKNKYRIKSARRPDWDYGWNAAYFITICTHNRNHYFGDIVNEQMQLSEIGKIAKKYWMEIPKHFPFVDLGAMIIMPNHTHGIIIINKPDYDDDGGGGEYRTVETLHATSLPPSSRTETIPKINKKMAFISPKKGSLSTIIRSYKSVVTKNTRKIQSNFSWQTRFHDHIIRNNQSFKRIEEYIRNNPQNWSKDKFYK